MSQNSFDAIVIGSGISGGWAAKELCEKGLTTLVLEQQLVLMGFFTSQPGVTRVLRYVPDPGMYIGCTDYIEGQTSWA